MIVAQGLVLVFPSLASSALLHWGYLSQKKKKKMKERKEGRKKQKGRDDI